MAENSGKNTARPRLLCDVYTLTHTAKAVVPPPPPYHTPTSKQQLSSEQTAHAQDGLS